MQKVSSIVCLSLSELVELTQQLKGQGQRLVFANLQAPVRQVTAITRLDKLFEIQDDPSGPDLREGDIVEVVRGDEDWQWISHLGLIARDDAERPTLVHSSAPRSSEELLEAYLRDHPDVLGVKVLRPKPPRSEIPPVTTTSTARSCAPDESTGKRICLPSCRRASWQQVWGKY